MYLHKRAGIHPPPSPAQPIPVSPANIDRQVNRFSPYEASPGEHRESNQRSDAHDTLDLRAGETVEVRSAAEILATLDARGEVDSMQFMPEMLQYCGQQFRVSHRADKTCDTIENYAIPRRLYRTVHLEQLRCDGRGHGGCQAGCMLYWKEAWLKRVEAAPPERALFQIQRQKKEANGASAEAVLRDLVERSARTSDQARTGDDVAGRYFCQATELLRASEPMKWWDPRQYARDIVTRNVSPGQFMRGCWFSIYGMIRRRLRAPRTYPYFGGKLKTTPVDRLNLQPGELVQIKSRKEIYATLDKASKNRGLYYDVEMWRFSGGTYRVLRRVERIINEKTGQMRNIPNGCVILDGVFCSGERSRNRLFCQRAIYSYWREVWLRRVT